ncbi:MAG: S41 family peptidase [Myxococcota bacterium]
MLCLLLSLLNPVHADTNGYYRYPAVHEDTVVFTSEGDLWRVGVDGGAAQRLTSHHGQETRAHISPDGQTIAFSAQYAGPTEVYVMPIDGGAPRRLTWQGDSAQVVGWTPEGEVLYTTRYFSTLPDSQLAVAPLDGRTPHPLPLSQAIDGAFVGERLIFTRFKQNSKTKRYEGGTAESLWRWDGEGQEAVELTNDRPGMSTRPLAWGDRVLFVDDRDGSMDLWSMLPDGSDLQQHTEHEAFDVAHPSVSGDTVVYQHGADLHRLTLSTGERAPISIQLVSDEDQTRTLWIDRPMDWMTGASPNADGSKVILTARGELFVAPVKNGGRLVQLSRDDGEVRWRHGRFAPDGSVLAIGDVGQEGEYHRFAADGLQVDPEALTSGASVWRNEPVPSPDGRWLAFTDKNYRLWLSDLKRGGDPVLIAEGQQDTPGNLAWSPDSAWLAYSNTAGNLHSQLFAYHAAEARSIALTTDRFGAYSPAWSPDGAWLYLLSDRSLRSTVPSPWGAYQPEPYIEKPTKVYALQLDPAAHFPFVARHELSPTEGKDDADKPAKKGKKSDTSATKVTLVEEGLVGRLFEVPVTAGNYGALSVNGDALFFTSRPGPYASDTSLVSMALTHDDPTLKTVVGSINGYEMTADRSKLLVFKQGVLAMVPAKPSEVGDLSKHTVDLSSWTFSITPRKEWRQMFVESWRLMRDYFYDQGLHGNDYQATLDTHLPLVDRVRDRAELSDLMAQMVGELSALHIFVYGGDQRTADDNVRVASLGVRTRRTEAGHEIVRSFPHDTDLPTSAPPLAAPGVDVDLGDVIVAIDGRPTAGLAELGPLLDNKIGDQVRLAVLRDGKTREFIVRPFSTSADAELRYAAWELTRRSAVEDKGEGRIGYVHLRAMGSSDYTQWARDFYPVFEREGLIVDVRHNRGGNIDSWILEKLMRKAWFYWQGRVGAPTWNMQYAFRGHLAVLCDQHTASDGEAFTEGVQRLELGHVIGKRTWGGEIWLSSSNRLVDRGIATAAEWGVYGPEGTWLIEGWGAVPDESVDNLPHGTFNGEDAQLDAAISYLKDKIANEPVPVPPVPAYPDKSRN